MRRVCLLEFYPPESYLPESYLSICRSGDTSWVRGVNSLDGRLWVNYLPPDGWGLRPA